jgi:hypothetical protein
MRAFDEMKIFLMMMATMYEMLMRALRINFGGCETQYLLKN